MSNRKRIPIETETKILVESARRCPLCFGLKGDLGRKAGQIAHIDQDSSNADESNLVYLCLDDHNEYDSRTSQSKGITAAELAEYKKRLNCAISNGEHLAQRTFANRDAIDAAAIADHDKEIFKASDNIMREASLIKFLERLQTDDSFTSMDIRAVDGFRRMFTERGNQYIDEELTTSLSSFLSAVNALLEFTASHFFVYPKEQSGDESIRYCMYPELNFDRGGSGTPDEMNRYDEYQKRLDTLVDRTRDTYENYRSTVKRVLVL